MTTLNTFERALRPSDALRTYHRVVRENANGLAETLLGWMIGVAVVVGLLLYYPPAGALPILLATAAGGLLVWTCHRNGPQGAWTVRTAAAWAAAAVVAGWALLVFAGGLAAAAVSLTAAEAFTRRPPQRGVSGTKWWSQNRLVAALCTAGVLKVEDGHPPGLHYVGKPWADDAGEWVTVELPLGHTWQDVKAKHDELASAMHLPERRLHIEHNREHAANAVTIAVLTAPAQATIPATLPERFAWADGVPMGRDRLGREVTYRTTNIHTAIVAATGAGKTALVRFLLSHAALDPKVVIYVINGKDDVEDLEPIAPLCRRYAGGASRKAIAEAHDILREVEALVEKRLQMPKAERTPVVLLIDEWFRLRGAAKRHDAKQAQDMDALKSELDATARAAGVQIVTVLQKGTHEYLPKEQAVNYMQKLVGMCESDKEARYVVDTVPEVLPAQPGEFLHKVGGSLTLFQAPWLDDEAFAAACQRAADLRMDESPEWVRPVGSTPAPEPVAPADPLHAAVVEVLRRGALQASVLYDRLPEQVRPAAAAVLGKRLAAMPNMESRYEGSVKVWAYAPTRRELSPLPPEEQPVPLASALAAPGGRGHLPQDRPSEAPRLAPTGTEGALPPVLKVVP